ncbi:serine aminopeptidase (family S33) [Skeletonema marinoi]|uniref:Serine aminopeptidase (Family S33) n=2 Tax=Skeletonema marinoi TaxID=267567 RepID=A0AAD8XY94_9STRA|nr:serine aminopeptidase (family S33) [Skeletonema marinoi]
MAISNKISNQPAALIAIITLASAAAVTLAFQQHHKKTTAANRNHPQNNMSSYLSKEAMIEAAGPPSLPDGFIVDSFTNSRSQSIFTIHLPRADMSVPPKAMFVLVHGTAEHCCRKGYIGLYESLSKAGVDVYSMDNHGNGRSDGEPRGYTESIDDYVEETIEYIQLVQKSKYEQDQCPPLVVMGHSLGGCIAVMTALKMGSGKSDISLILSSPALGVDMNLELKVQKFFAPVIDFVCPKARIVDVVDAVEMSRNEEAVKAYIDDPLCPIGKMIAHTAIATDKAFDYAKQRRGEIYCPTLMLHSPDDKCTSQKASEDFFANIGTALEDKRYLKLNGMYHETLEEPETERIVKSIVTFVASGGKEFVEDVGNGGVVEMFL